MKRKILIVEDEPNMSRGLKDNLEFEGYEVDAADNGATGLSMILANAYALVVMDVMMPEMSGLDVLKKVRGIGLGRALIQKSLDYAIGAGYKKVYLETMPELQQALATYQKFGFEYINQPMGNSGHFGCDLWMLKELGS